LPTCLADLEKIVADGEAVVSDVKSFNIPGAIADVQDLVSVVEKLSTDCQLGGYEYP
jgi:hypothetical protein